MPDSAIDCVRVADNGLDDEGQEEDLERVSQRGGLLQGEVWNRPLSRRRRWPTLGSKQTRSKVPMTERGREAFIAEVAFDRRGLVPAVAQAADSGEVLMMAWMNADSLRETLRSGRVCYWSRSRQALWRKGETSGHVQTLVEARVDCDGDTLLLLVDQLGPACHTKRPNCFYRALRDGSLVEISQPMDKA